MKKLLILILLLFISCTNHVHDTDTPLIVIEKGYYNSLTYKYIIQYRKKNLALHHRFILVSNKDYKVGDTLRIITK